MSASVTSLFVASICLAQILGLVPDSTQAVLHGRAALCEAVATTCGYAVQKGDTGLLRTALQQATSRNPEMLSAAARRADGKILAEVGNHGPWTPLAGYSTPTEVEVPLRLGDQAWGDIEFRFRPLAGAGPWGVIVDSGFRFVTFVAVTSFVLCFLCLKMMRARMSAVLAVRSSVPERVRSALDALAEGVVLVDRTDTIALANKAFAATVGVTENDVEGHGVAEFTWTQPNSSDPVSSYPWDEALQSGQSRMGSLLGLKSHDGRERTLSVNATPVIAADGTCGGVLATFDDLTPIQDKNVKMKRLLEKLKLSRLTIRAQSRQFRYLARFDPLTNCLNRRAFFEDVQPLCDAASRHGYPLSCLLVDIDHFKKINDTYGHGVGDQALQHVAATLRAASRSSDLVCRYGGEEFCVVLPHLDSAQAEQAAERLRREVAAAPFTNFSMTASFGVAQLPPCSSDIAMLLDRADKALYAAKDSGRNRVVSWVTISHSDRAHDSDEVVACTRATVNGNPTTEEHDPPHLQLVR